MTISFHSEVQAELYSVLARQGSPQEASVDRVLRQQRRLVADHRRILHVRDLAVRVAEVRVQIEPVRRSGGQLELAPLVPGVEIAEVLGRGRGIEVEEVAVVRVSVV